MFNDISKTYDVTNRVLSFGIDRRWREIACKESFSFYNKSHIETILDVACGTGDMCENWDKFAKKLDINVDNIFGVDPSIGMLDEAKKKRLNTEFIKAEAKDLPFKNESVDIVSISYGLRNVIDREDGLKEFYRVLKNDGLLVILEFTKKKNRTFSTLIRDLYMQKLLPIIGGVISRNFGAYGYLPNSIDHFLTKDNLVSELENIGFNMLKVESYSMDISTMFIVRK
jgi:demethylmenaquinone methyltransferase/2-methoxy-6-polyprenyl-1,4-benzoquinol methylase